MPRDSMTVMEMGSEQIARGHVVRGASAKALRVLDGPCPDVMHVFSCRDHHNCNTHKQTQPQALRERTGHCIDCGAVV